MTDEPPSRSATCDVIVEPAWRDAGVDLDALTAACAHAALERAGVDPATVELSVRFTDDAAIAELNAVWRDKPEPTDVLAFPADPEDGPRGEGAPRLLGDVVLAFETCARDARALSRPLSAHLHHLLIHGLLHLLGYDHGDPDDAARMEAFEVAVLADLALPDPYAGPPLTEEIPR